MWLKSYICLLCVQLLLNCPWCINLLNADFSCSKISNSINKRYILSKKRRDIFRKRVINTSKNL